MGESTLPQKACRVAWTSLLKQNPHRVVEATLGPDETAILLKLADPRDRLRAWRIELAFGDETVTLKDTDGADPRTFTYAELGELRKLLNDRYDLAYRP